MSIAETSAAASKAIIERLSPQDAAKALPFRFAQSSALIEGVETNVVTQHYADCILVIVTQVGKIGALTQITTHKRPQMPTISDEDDLLNDDFDSAKASNAYQRSNIPHNGIKTQADDLIDGSSDTTTSLNLFGTVPAGHETLYDFYKHQISASIQADLRGEGVGSENLGSKPVIVGLSLKLPSPTHGNDEDDDDFAEVADSEKGRFEAIMDLVKQARTW